MSELQTSGAPESPVREGDILAGKYRVERVLGVGGMGVVVAATHTELDQKVALKFLLPQAAANPQVVARFSREARAAAKIKSEHVARVSDVGTMENGTPYIVMEYLDGYDLSHALEARKRLPAGLAVDYVLQACEALAEAHAGGIVHRDLKPGNLFVAHRNDGGETVKVLDFGISKEVIAGADPSSVKPGQLTRTTDIFGSPTYMSPEQLKSSRDVDARADIWAIGVILYELITGTSPFERGTVAETFGAILYEKPQSMTKLERSCPPELEAAIFRCLEKDANARHQNVAELAKALLPFGERSTRETVERTSRVLKRAGVDVKSVPPPGPGARPAATNLSPGASTRTSWGSADRAPGPGSKAGPVLAGVAGMIVAAGIFVAITRLGKKPADMVKPAADPIASGVSAVQPAPTVSVSAMPQASAVPAVPTVAPVTSVTAGPTAAPLGQHNPHAKAPAGAKSAAPTASPAPTGAPAAPPPPRPKPEDPNDFGDRK